LEDRLVPSNYSLGAGVNEKGTLLITTDDHDDGVYVSHVSSGNTVVVLTQGTSVYSTSSFGAGSYYQIEIDLGDGNDVVETTINAI
jgi:hypothetical protein